MERAAGRALAKTTLEGIGLFDLITDHEPDKFSGSAFATIHSKSLGMVQDGRDCFASPAEIWVSIYVQRPTGGGADTEDTLDDLTRSAMRALFDAFGDAANNLQIGPSETGYPQRPIDGKQYRMERFAVQFDDDEV